MTPFCSYDGKPRVYRVLVPLYPWVWGMSWIKWRVALEFHHYTLYVDSNTWEEAIRKALKIARCQVDWVWQVDKNLTQTIQTTLYFEAVN